MYYYSVGGEELEGQSRPYYMFVIGDRDVLASINKRVPFSEVKHGIANKAGAGNVTVTIKRQQRNGADGVLVEVSDDGVGRTEAAHAGGSSTKQGLKILQQQIELYNRANRHQIVQHVTDLTDDAGRPAGTCFETWVPADYQY